MADDASRDGTRYGNPDIHELLETIYGDPGPAFADALGTLERTGMPKIQVSPTDGRILKLLMHLAGAHKVVEFGTLSGYSALWLLAGMTPQGHLWTLELEQAHTDAAAGVFQRGGVAPRVTQLTGDGRNFLAGLAEEGPFDAVFIDADKEGYETYALWALDNLRPGGLLLADNAYLFGLLAGDDPEHAAARKSVIATHRLLADRFVAACLPTPDGLAVGVKASSGKE
jgi:caffeoyl-CoA O-methyltransferase